MRRLLSKHGYRWAIGLILVLLAAAQAMEIIPSPLIERFEVIAYDMRMRIIPPKLDPRIVIVDIDEKSLNEFGRWPWSRNITADLVDKLTDHYKVRAVGFDISFSEPDLSSGYTTLENLANRELKDVAAVKERLEKLKPQLDYDGRLAKAIQGQPVVLGYFLTDRQKKGVLPNPAFTVKDLDGYKLYAHSVAGYEANIPVLQKAARAGGFYNATDIDSDGTLRSTPLLIQVGDGFYESLALATARVALGATKVKPIFLRDAILSEQELKEYGILDSIRLENDGIRKKIPVESFLKTRIQFRGRGGPDGGAFRYVSAADVLKGNASTSDLSNRIVLIGTTAPGLFDLRATPVRADYPGVEVHANVIKSILDGEFKQKPDFELGFNLVQVMLVGLILIVALSSLSPLYSVLFTLATGASVVGFNFWMYESQNMVLPVAAVLILISALFVMNIAWGYLFEYRKGRAMVNLFGEYVAPELVAVMSEDPESYNMEGESRELTVLFCDVRGFTTISEGLQPNDLREYINRYLTAMSEDIRGNRGTLDKYIGDAVMAFWGAPVALPDHAARAVATALQMQATAKKLNDDFVARGWPPLKIGIGLNTGEMRVGDMGSKIRRAYTVMGDAVNLGSRLEGITKEYGVGLVVGEMTKLAASDYAYRELDRVRVKGKNEPVPIFEPLGLAGELPEETHHALEKWHQALALVRGQKWYAAEQLLQQLRQEDPDRKLYALYLQRIAYYRERPPGENWDGVTTFETK
ncbi:MAG: adenylate/guanylate cyclase domain-containing protein [Burkholderiales bacterium]|nr:adenylate/guanylate cyclase domain-containing protein [Burkholderiales bacterium]